MTTNNGQRFFFISDTHFNHIKILQYVEERRHFSSVEEMNETLINNINKVVRSKDVLIHAGDFAWTYGNEESIHSLLDRIHCNQIHLTIGNHDRKPEIYEKHRKISSVSQIKEFKINGQRIVVSHYPMLAWNGSHNGSWNIHGHIHSNINHLLDKAHPNGPRFNVCVDVLELYPISFEELKERAKYRKPNWDYEGTRGV